MACHPSSDTPSLPRNQAVVWRFVQEVINRGEVGRLADYVATDHLNHGPDGDLYGRAGVRLDVEELRAAFSDLHLNLTEVEGDGDRIAYRFQSRGTHAGPFLGIPASERRVELSGTAVHRLIDGLIVETWTNYDVFPLMWLPNVVGPDSDENDVTEERTER